MSNHKMTYSVQTKTLLWSLNYNEEEEQNFKTAQINGSCPSFTWTNHVWIYRTILK